MTNSTDVKNAKYYTKITNIKLDGRRNMRRNQHSRRAFIDRLEKKYMKKVQLQAFHHENEQLKHRLESLAGSNLRTWRQGGMDLTDIPDYKLNYSR